MKRLLSHGSVDHGLNLGTAAMAQTSGMTGSKSTHPGATGSAGRTSSGGASGGSSR